jgi:hypothetical protein
MNAAKNIATLRSLFLSAVGLVHVIVFWSYYVQFPGLLSSSGIEPVHRLMPYASPWLHQQLISTRYIDYDSLCELLALMGMVVGAVLASRLCQHGSLYLWQTLVYSLLVRSGGTFYSFQWDILLLEVTMVTALTYAPWRHARPNDMDFSSISAWPLRLVLFKLMYMSGIVKLQAHCPTWLHLTALEYHFATQCLPGPWAWYAHQLHPLFLRFSVAVTLWIELPVTLLLLIPLSAVAQIGAILQILLQVVIFLTGNYNYFNLLTILLCLVVMEKQSSDAKRRWWEVMLCGVFLAWSLHAMITWERYENQLNVKLAITPQQLDRWTERYLPLIIDLVLLWVLIQTMIRSRPLSVLHGTVCLLVMSVVAVPMSTLTPLLQRQGVFLWQAPNRWVQPLYKDFARPYLLSNGYGLFRRMTGVGSAPDTEVGWAGLPPSVVERPEIILEALYDDGDDEWHEINFRWKPGNVYAMPRQVAPHQPRLDWQMWFAALGRLNHNPWLIHLVAKLLDACPPVVKLLGDERLLKQQPRQIRANLYHYDFTRVQSEWSKTIHGLELVSSDCASYWLHLLTRNPEQVWNRTIVANYMPPLEKDNANLINYIESQGYKSKCIDPKVRCLEAPSLWCNIAFIIRAYHLHLLVPLLLLASRIATYSIKLREGLNKQDVSV